MTTRVTPLESFPEDLPSLSLPEVEVLNSRIQRELSHEYAHDGEPRPETELRGEELTEELDRRDAEDEDRLDAVVVHQIPESLVQSPAPALGIAQSL